MNTKTVLVVDDDLDLCDNLEDILKNEGYEPFSATTCAEGLKLARELRPKVAILDQKLPDGQGTTLLSELKQLYPDCVCIIMTAYADVDSAVAALEKAAYHYLQKPVHPRKLLGVLAGAFEMIQLRNQKRLAEAALRKEKAFVESALDTLTDAFFVFDLEGRFIRWNKVLSEVTGYSNDEISSAKPTDLFSGEDVQRVLEAIGQVVKKGHIRIEASVVTKEGRSVPYEFIGGLLRDDQGNPLSVCAVGRDITERMRVEEEKWKLEVQLQQAQKMEAIGTLAGGIAHDFNNILSAIMGYIQLSYYKTSEPIRLRQYLDKTLKAIYRAKDLTNQILAFSRKSEQEQKPVQVHLIVKEALKLLSASLPSTIETRQNITPESDTILGDATQIHQVLMNLCTNAHHAIGEKGGVLEVTLIPVDLDAEAVALYPDLAPGPYVELTVRDTGHGMDPAAVDRIYDPYFTTKEKDVGTGLGLTVVHGIVKSHGGSIGVSSEPGKGTTFNILFPRLEVGAEEEAKPQEALLVGHERILFVDDEEDLVEIGKQMLEHLGYEFVAEISSIEALKVFRAQSDKFDLVITDQTMPKMAGSELAQELMRIRPDIPIMLCTGYNKVISEEKAKAIGIREFLMKPLDIHDLAKAIRRVLDT
jgi:PAS domain S-box-containing protein